MIAADIQPIQNLSVLKRVSPDDITQQNEWGHWVVSKGLEAVEKRLGNALDVIVLVTRRLWPMFVLCHKFSMRCGLV